MSKRVTARRRQIPQLAEMTDDHAGWEGISLLPNPLPEFSLDQVDTSTVFLGKRCALPLLLCGRAGNSDAISLAALAQQHQIALLVRQFDPARGNQAQSFESIAPVREVAPEIPLIGEIPASALIAQPGLPPLDPEPLLKSATKAGVDALSIRLDFGERAIARMPVANGRGVIEAIHQMTYLDIPVYVDCVTGIPRRPAQMLVGRGIDGIIVAGRFSGSTQGFNGDGIYSGWGIPTPAAIRMLRGLGVSVVADRAADGGHAGAKALALGADMLTIDTASASAGGFSLLELAETITAFGASLATTMYLCGTPSLARLKQAPFVATGSTRHWLEAAEASWRTMPLGSQ